MKENWVGRALFWIAVAFTGFIAGYIVFDDAAEIRSLKSLLSEAESNVAASQDANRQHPARQKVFQPAEDAQHVPSRTHFNTNDLPPYLTEQDLEAAQALNIRSRAGEYILQLERPTDRKATEAAMKDLVSKMASNKVPELGAVFAQLGMDPEKNQQLQKHAEKIMLASLEAEMGIQQVLTARADHDKRVRSLLSDEDYARYREYEGAQLAVREYGTLQEYAGQKNITLDPAYQQFVTALVQQANAYTDNYWHGPYDGLAPVTVGREAVINRREQQVTQLTEAVNQLKQKAFEASLPEYYMSALDAYYKDKIQMKQARVDAMRNPPARVAPGK